MLPVSWIPCPASILFASVIWTHSVLAEAYHFQVLKHLRCWQFTLLSNQQCWVKPFIEFVVKFSQICCWFIFLDHKYILYWFFWPLTYCQLQTSRWNASCRCKALGLVVLADTGGWKADIIQVKTESLFIFPIITGNLLLGLFHFVSHWEQTSNFAHLCPGEEL